MGWGPAAGGGWGYTAGGMRRSAWWGLASVAVGLGWLFWAAWAGWLGPLVTCGPDRAAVCVAWPGLASAAVWLLFISTIAGLVLAQARDWRQTSVARREVIWLLLIMAAALGERLWRVDLALVGYDESSAAALVAAWRYAGLFPLTGIVSSISIPNPPAWPYLLASVLVPFGSPYALLGLGIAASLLTVLLVWWVGRRWIGPWGALAAAAFYAGGFWATFLGRSAWQPVFLQVAVVVCLDALLVLAVRRWAWALTIACGWFALMVQLHYLSVVFVPLLALAAWPARRVLRPVHIAAGLLVGVALLAPFLVYELDPAVRLRDLTGLSSEASIGAHLDLDSWNLFWTLASNGGAAGLGGPDTAALRQTLGRWSNLGWLGIPLVGLGVLACVGGWPRGWRGWLLAAWAVMPIVGLARHSLGIIFHYLYMALPGMALAVGGLAEWTAIRRWRVPRLIVGAALGLYAAVSAATLWAVLGQVDTSGVYPAQGRPIGLNITTANATRAVLPPGGNVLIGGPAWEVEALRFSLGYDIPARTFDECGTLPLGASSVYLLSSEQAPAAVALAAAGAPVLARVPRPDGAFVVFGTPSGPVVDGAGAGADTIVCRDRGQ
jgi:hypothetical protein